MKARSGRFLGTDRLAVRVLGHDRRKAEGLSSLSLLLGTRFFFDLREKRGDALAIEIVRQVAPNRFQVTRGKNREEFACSSLRGESLWESGRKIQ
jgi:hypothetical protein